MESRQLKPATILFEISCDAPQIGLDEMQISQIGRNRKTGVSADIRTSGELFDTQKFTSCPNVGTDTLVFDTLVFIPSSVRFSLHILPFVAR
jgi:hypothetical protein